MGYVYLLLQTDDGGSESHKIGVSKRDVTNRIKELQTGNPNTITILTQYESKNYIKIEKWLHRKFKPKHEKGEWFKLSDSEVFAFIDECKIADDNINFLLENNEFYK